MPRPPSRTVFVVVPGASQTPSHYAYLLHLLHTHGYPTYTALIPSTGVGEAITAEDDKDYIRSHMLLPVLDIEKHNVIMVMHSYSGIPGSGAALGLGKEERTAQGKTTSVLGQIYIASMIAKGDDGKDIVGTFGGHLPPHIGVDVSTYPPSHLPKVTPPSTANEPLAIGSQGYSHMRRSWTTIIRRCATSRIPRSHGSRIYVSQQGFIYESLPSCFLGLEGFQRSLRLHPHSSGQGRSFGGTEHDDSGIRSGLDCQRYGYWT